MFGPHPGTNFLGPGEYSLGRAGVLEVRGRPGGGKMEKKVKKSL